MKKIGEEVVALFKQRLKANGSNFTGQLISSFEYKISNTNIEIYANDYAAYLNDGTRGTETGLPNRKMPPIKAIEPWAKAHNLNPWAVAKHIQMYGTKAHPFMEDDDNEVNKIITDNMDQYFEFITKKVYENLQKVQTKSN